ncbi:MAG: methyltransferase domain-containing protein [Bacillota bacterium]
MNKVFNSGYADAYDAIYSDKDYEAECDLIERIFRDNSGSIISILDLGCGTGNHLIPLAQRGYELTGIDRSESMLAHARSKVDRLSHSVNITLHQGDVRNLELNRHFDAAIMMFAVLGYQLENRDVLSALHTVRRHLRPGGLFLFDVWYGPAVLHQRPSQRIKVIPTHKGKILRVSSGELDTGRHICKVYFHLWRLEENRVAAETTESHSMRYFFPLELNLFLECSGFAPVRLGAFPEFERDPDETTWNVLALVRAV